jgi:hypothetical protein
MTALGLGLSIDLRNRKDYSSVILSQLPQVDATGKINLGLWEDVRDDDIRLLDHEGVIRIIPGALSAIVPGGIVPYQDARIIQNLWPSSDDSDTPTTQIITTISGHEYQLTIGADSANGSTAVCSGAFVGTLTGDAVDRQSWNNGIPKTATTTSLTVTITGAVTKISLEDVTGQANQNPGEYQKVDAANSLYGFAYYATENGNTVDGSGVVTEAVGANLSPAPTMVHWPSSTNYYINSDAPVTQTIDLTATGTGDYTLSVIGGGTVTSADVGATGTGHGAASAGTDITFNLSVAGTVSFTVAAGIPDYVQVEKKAFSTPPIVTAGSSVSRDVTGIRHPFAGYFNQVSGVCLLDFAVGHLMTTNAGVLSIRENSASVVYNLTTNGLYAYDGSGASGGGLTITTVDDIYRTSVRWETDGDLQIGRKNITGAGDWFWDVTLDSYDGAFTEGAGWINIGYGNNYHLVIHKLSIYNKVMTITQIEALPE